ncbi:MAG: hypothetical protein SNJ62_03350 [Chloracidobacterium sp.]
MRTALQVWLCSIFVVWPLLCSVLGDERPTPPPPADSLTIAPDILPGCQDADIYVHAVSQTANPYAVRFFITRNHTGNTILNLQLTWLLFDVQTGNLLESGTVTPRRIPAVVVAELKKSNLAELTSFVGRLNYGLPLDTFENKYRGQSRLLVFAVERAEFSNGKLWNREIAPTLGRSLDNENDQGSKSGCPNQNCEPLKDGLGNVTGFRCSDFAKGLRCENHGTYCTVYPCEAVQPQGKGRSQSPIEDWWVLAP